MTKVGTQHFSIPKFCQVNIEFKGAAERSEVKLIQLTSTELESCSSLIQIISNAYYSATAKGNVRFNLLLTYVLLGNYTSIPLCPLIDN